MRKLKLLFATLALVVGGSNSAWAGTDVTASYIGDLNAYSKGGWEGDCGNNHTESAGIGWWNTQSSLSGGHSFRDGESWCPNVGTAGVMIGRTMVLPAGNYTLKFEAYGATTSNATDKTVPTSGDVKTFFSGSTSEYDVTNTTLDDETYHEVSYTFDVTTDNTAYTFGIKKLSDESKANWARIKNVSLVLNSDNIFPVANNDKSTFTYTGEQTWQTNTWSTEGQSDGSRFQVPFHELWRNSNQNAGLGDASITGSYTPTETGVYKISAWVRAVNERGGDVTGVKIFVGDAETDACTGSSVIGGKGRLGTYTAMADGVSGTPFNYGFKIKDAEINWLTFKNVVITYLGSLPDAEANALISQATELLEKEMDEGIKTTLNTAKTTFEGARTVANYNALATAIADAQASADAYALFAPEKAKALALGMTTEAIAAVAPNVKALKVAEYNYVSTNYQYAVKLGTWNASDNAGEMTGQHWDGGTTSSYLEQGAGDLAYNKSSWTVTYDQNLLLPAGNYVFKVAGRTANDHVTLNLNVTDVTDAEHPDLLGTVNDFPKGDIGLGINKSGATSFDSEDAAGFANDGKGRGWEWRYVKFTLANPATVKVAVVAEADAQYRWMGFCNATVQTDNADNVDLMTALVALNDAKTAATLTKNTTNVGTGVFQCIESSNNSLWSNYETAKSNAEAYAFTSSSTADEVNTLATALNTAISNYKNQPLNAPAADKHYNIIVATSGHAKEDNAIVLDRVAEYPVMSSTYVSNNTGFTLNASATPNANLAQACVFTAVDGKPNTYNISMERSEGTVYLTYGSLNDSKVNWKNDQIQATENDSKKGEFKIVATSTANVFNIINTESEKKIGCEDGGNIYTLDEKADFTIAEAAQASVNIKINADVKYGTRIFPFKPTLPSAIKAYSCEAATGNTLTLVEVDSPAADTPYILEVSADVDETLEGWGVAGATTKTAGWLTGVYEKIDAIENTYVLQNQSGTVGFYKVESIKPIVGANRCYLTVPASSREAYFFNTEATAIDAIEMLTSGKATIFNASGAQVPALEKGINIIKTNDGKVRKVMVK